MSGMKMKDRQFLLELLHCYSKKDIMDMAKRFLLQGYSSLAKEELIGFVADFLLKKETLSAFLMGMTQEELRVFLCVQKEEEFFLDVDEIPLFSYFLDNAYAGVTQDMSMRILHALYDVYEELESNTYYRGQERISRVYLYASAAVQFYGIVPVSQLLRIFNHYEKKKMGQEELLRILKENLCFRSEFIFKDGEIIDSRLVREERVEELRKLQADKPFRMPTMSQINELTIQENFSKNIYTEKLQRFLEKYEGKTQGKNGREWQAEELVYEIRSMVMYGCELRDVLLFLEYYGIRLQNEKEKMEFCQLFLAMWNHTPMMGNRGYTPIEMARHMGQDFKELPKGSFVEEEVYQKMEEIPSGEKVIDFSREREKRRK